MSLVEPGKIRNVAVVGHRGTGKTSLVEAMLFQGGATNRLGVVEQGTTVSDWDEDEQSREMSISASLCHLEWQSRKINLIDTPGEPSFAGDAISSLHVVEGALVTVSGVMGVEVQTARNWHRAEELGLARVVFVNMLDRERADFYRILEQLRDPARLAMRGHPSADRLRARGERNRRSPAHDGLHEPRGRTRGEARRDSRRARRSGRAVSNPAPRLGRRDGRGPDGALPRRTGALTRGGRRRDEDGRHARRAVPGRVRSRDEEPRHDRGPRPAGRGDPVSREEGPADRDRRRSERSLRLQDCRRPVRGPHQHLSRPRRPDRGGLDPRQRAQPRQGARRPAPDAAGQGSRAGPGVRRRRPRRRLQAQGRPDRRPAARQRPRGRAAEPRLPRAGDELRDHAQGQGRRGEGRDLPPPPERGGPDPPPASATRRPASSSCPG